MAVSLPPRSGQYDRAHGGPGRGAATRRRLSLIGLCALVLTASAAHGNVFADAGHEPEQANAPQPVVQGDASGEFCLGDGSQARCPCANPGEPGRGCDNAQETGGARLTAVRRAWGGVTLLGSGLPPGEATTVVVLEGGAPADDAPAEAFGDGLLCLQGQYRRTRATQAVQGYVEIDLREGESAGTRAFQLWYRSEGSFCDPAPFNLSNGALMSD